MFLTHLKTLLREAMAGTFTDAYTYPNGSVLTDDGVARDLWVSLDYPNQQANYPGIWVDFTPTTDVQAAGLDRYELTEPDEQGLQKRVGVWRFGGMAQFTCVALTSVERDALVDEVVKVVAFGKDNFSRKYFREFMENNDLIRTSMQWDKVQITGKAETQGTSWGTNEIIYEHTVAIDCEGQFYASPDDAELVPLSAIVAYPIVQGQPAPPATAGGDWM